jgi:hypothetical protein
MNRRSGGVNVPSPGSVNPLAWDQQKFDGQGEGGLESILSNDVMKDRQLDLPAKPGDTAGSQP